MTTFTVTSGNERRYGFNVYKDGLRTRELVVIAGNPVIAEIKAPRYLADGEYLWYVVPRLIDGEEGAS